MGGLLCAGNVRARGRWEAGRTVGRTALRQRLHSSAGTWGRCLVFSLGCGLPGAGARGGVLYSQGLAHAHCQGLALPECLVSPDFLAG